MALEKRFRQTLESNIRTIKDTLMQKIKDAFNNISEANINIEGVKQINKEIDDADIAINEARKIRDSKVEKLHEDFDDFYQEKKKEVEELQSQIDEILPTVSTRTDNEDSMSDKARSIYNLVNFRTKYTGHRSAKIYKAEADALETVKDGKEYRSYMNFKEIEEHTINLFNMAATNKEARMILMAFQNKNWIAMGVNLPVLNMTDAFDITDSGEITMKAISAPVGD